jgi:hypothetical protein
MAFLQNKFRCPLGNLKNLKDLKDLQGGLDAIRKEAWPFYRTSSGVRLCWDLEEPKGPKGLTIDHPSLVRLCWELGEPKGPEGHVFNLTSEVSVVGACMSLILVYHGPSADLLYPAV